MGGDIEAGHAPVKNTPVPTAVPSNSSGFVKKVFILLLLVVVIVGIIGALVALNVVDPEEVTGSGNSNSGGTSAPTTEVEVTESPTFPPVPSPIEPATSSPVTSPIEPPTSSPVTSPIEPPTSSPVTSPIEPPTSSPVTSPIEPPTSSPVTSPIEPPTSSPVTSPTEPPTSPPVDDQEVFGLFPKEFRRPNDFISVSFASNDGGDAAFQITKRVAERWSDIVEGTGALPAYQIRSLNAGDSFCFDPQSEPKAQSDVDLDHLRVYVLYDEDEFDGAFAGPCRTDFGNTFLPYFGTVTVGKGAFDRLSAGVMEALMVHEVGHILGIGTSWGASFLQLLSDPVDPENIDGTASPQFNGEQAALEYSAFTGSNEDSVPVEDGFTNGVRNNAGEGSVNGHFDQDALGNEIMTFFIQGSNAPLSRISLGSLIDVGFIVNMELADAFPQSRKRQSPTGDEEGIFLGNDIVMYEEPAYEDE